MPVVQQSRAQQAHGPVEDRGIGTEEDDASDEESSSSRVRACGRGVRGSARHARRARAPVDGHGGGADRQHRNGYKVFNDYFCVACHTLKAGGPAAYGQLEINFNKIKAPYPVAVQP